RRDWPAGEEGVGPAGNVAVGIKVGIALGELRVADGRGTEVDVEVGVSVDTNVGVDVECGGCGLLRPLEPAPIGVAVTLVVGWRSPVVAVGEIWAGVGLT